MRMPKIATARQIPALARRNWLMTALLAAGLVLRVLAQITSRPALLVTLTLPEHVDPGHVRFARDLALMAARYATEVERAWRGLPPLPAPIPA